MSRIALLSEDPVFSGLVSRNLQKRGHQVAVHLVSASSLESRRLVDALSMDDLVILDLHWYDPSRLETYGKLVDVSTELHQPIILLVDGTWTGQWAERFHATTTLRKPFSIDRVLQAVEQHCDSSVIENLPRPLAPPQA